MTLPLDPPHPAPAGAPADPSSDVVLADVAGVSATDEVPHEPHPPADGVDAVPLATVRLPGSVSVELDGDPIRVVLAGDVDVAVKDDLFEAVAAAARPGRPVEVDCRAVTFLDSTGVGALAWLCELAADPPCLVGVPPVTRDLLRLVGLDGRFRFAP